MGEELGAWCCLPEAGCSREGKLQRRPRGCEDGLRFMVACSTRMEGGSLARDVVASSSGESLDLVAEAMKSMTYWFASSGP